jgi:hypothetical protein
LRKEKVSKKKRIVSADIHLVQISVRFSFFEKKKVGKEETSRAHCL